MVAGVGHRSNSGSGSTVCAIIIIQFYSTMHKALEALDKQWCPLYSVIVDGTLVLRRTGLCTWRHLVHSI